MEFFYEYQTDNLIALLLRSPRKRSSSDPPLSVVWPLRARGAAASRRLRLPPSTTPAPAVLLKLLQPKPTRPAIYSLDGFVPKPSIQRAVSTEPPPNFVEKNLQLLASVPRRRKVWCCRCEFCWGWIQSSRTLTSCWKRIYFSNN